MKTIEDYVDATGPCLTSKVSQWLVSEEQLTPEAARKRLSRVKPPLRTFPVSLLPKSVRFMYLESQRTQEKFWLALQRDLRATGSVYGMALDGLLARRGAIRLQNFPIISGATTRPVKKQVMADTVLERLNKAGLVTEKSLGDERVIAVCRHEIGHADFGGMKARDAAERIILDGLREWARHLGMASNNKIRIRGEPELEPVGQFQFDLAGPSYILPLKRGPGKQPGFFVADVFSQGVLDEYHIRYFVRKAHALHATLTGSSVMAILVADGFTGSAITAGHAAGILMATPSSLFGKRVGNALITLLETLTRAAAYASSDTPDRLIGLIANLTEIEGRAGNLRGPLFELIAAYLARRDAVSIDMGVRATDPQSGRQVDIDVLKFTSQNSECIAIECKGREPGGVVTEEEVGVWLKKLPLVQAHLRSQSQLQETHISFELWTSGNFSPEAIARLTAAQEKRVRHPIAWKNGADVLMLATKHKEKAMANALREHFLRHPLSEA